MLPHFDDTAIAFQYKSNTDLRRAQLLFSSMSSPFLTNLGMTVTNLAMKIGLPVEGLVKQTIYKQFCGGTNIQEAAQTANMLGKYGIGVILDYGAEGKEAESEFDKAVPEFIKAIEYAAGKPNIPFISIKITGFAKFALLQKIHENVPLSPQEMQDWETVKKRIDRICEAGFKKQVKVLIDAEETWIQHAVNLLANTMMERYNRKEAIVYNTFQLYAHATLSFLKKSLEEAESKNYILGAKLVRGAYMEKERNRAKENGYPSPIQPDKKSTDQDFDDAVIFCLEHLYKLDVFIGTHNEKSCLLAAKFMEDHNLPFNNRGVYFSQLFGMSDNISFNLSHAGFNVAKYLPYGPVKDVIPYLMRRAQENTSVAGQTGRELSLINKELKRRKSKKS